MESVIFFFNVILLVGIWLFLVRPAFRDYSRDMLFDLRDKLRADFIKNGWSIDTPVYGALRGLVNDNLRFIDRASLTRILVSCYFMERNPEAKDAISSRIAEIFNSKNDDIKKYASDYKVEVGKVLLFWMTTSSFPLIVFMFIIGSIISVNALIHKVKLSFKSTFSDSCLFLQKLFNPITPSVERLEQFVYMESQAACA